jgi:hypothetical protein
MIVGSCFEGDVDMALAGVQRDLYFASGFNPELLIDRASTLGWIWANVVWASWTRGNPWLDRNVERMQRINRGGFSHKLLQIPHAHIAAYFRWIMPRIERRSVITTDHGPYPLDLLTSWKIFLRKEIPDLLAADDALVALAKSVVYQSFDAGDHAYYEFQDILMRRYGFACVEKESWAAEVRGRVEAAADQSLERTSQRGAYA